MVLSQFIKKGYNHLVNNPVSIYPLVWLRIIFGALLVFSTSRFLLMGWVHSHFIEPSFHFKYFGFYWVEPLGATGMYLIYTLLLLVSLAFCLGYYYRLASVLVFLIFTYTELIDLTYYLNHYYFVSLMAFLMIFLPANRLFSLDLRLGRVTPVTQVPAWMINAFKLMIAIVYTYAGLAKLNSDWLLLAMPLKLWLGSSGEIPILGPFFAWKWSPYLFSWAGMLFDCFIIGFIIYRPTRLLAFIAVVVFHLTTGILFNIGVFPIVMILMVTCFFQSSWHRNILMSIAREFDPWHLQFEKGEEIQFNDTKVMSRLVKPLFAFFFLFQLLFPWRYLMYPGNMFWTEEGYRFSWRVMLVEKSGTALFYVREGTSGKDKLIPNNTFLTDSQEKEMNTHPDMILQYAHYLGEFYNSQGYNDPQIHAKIYVGLNGRPSQLFIDPSINLLDLEDGWESKHWILSSPTD